MAAPMRLEQFTILDDGRYRGAVYGRPGIGDGTLITTGHIDKSEDGVLTTKTARYRLGVARPPSPAAPSRPETSSSTRPSSALSIATRTSGARTLQALLCAHSERTNAIEPCRPGALYVRPRLHVLHSDLVPAHIPPLRSHHATWDGPVNYALDQCVLRAWRDSHPIDHGLVRDALLSMASRRSSRMDAEPDSLDTEITEDHLITTFQRARAMDTHWHAADRLLLLRLGRALEERAARVSTRWEMAPGETALSVVPEY